MVIQYLQGEPGNETVSDVESSQSEKHYSNSQCTAFSFTQGNTTTQDNHIYYTSVYYPPNSTEANDLWMELNDMKGVVVDIFDDGSGEVPSVSPLSELHRYYEVMILVNVLGNSLCARQCTQS